MTETRASYGKVAQSDDQQLAHIMSTFDFDAVMARGYGRHSEELETDAEVAVRQVMAGVFLGVGGGFRAWRDPAGVIRCWFEVAAALGMEA